MAHTALKTTTCNASSTLLIQLPANGLRKTAPNGLSTWAPATHMGDPEETPSLGLYPAPDAGVC